MLYVKANLGYEQIGSTLKCINLEIATLRTTVDQFTVWVASDVREACALVEASFEHVTGEYTDSGRGLSETEVGMRMPHSGKAGKMVLKLITTIFHIPFIPV